MPIVIETLALPDKILKSFRGRKLHQKRYGKYDRTKKVTDDILVDVTKMGFSLPPEKARENRFLIPNPKG